MYLFFCLFFSVCMPVCALDGRKESECGWVEVDGWVNEKPPQSSSLDYLNY